MEEMSTILRRPIVARVLDQHPDLGMNGFMTPSEDGPNDEEFFLASRSVLLDELGIGQIEIACVFLREAIQGRPVRFSAIDSDNLSHVIKSSTYRNGQPAFYFPGAVIVAAIICGLEVVRKENSPHATILFITYFEMLS